MEYKHIIVETSENVGIITLNRGSVLNAQRNRPSTRRF